MTHSGFCVQRCGTLTVTFSNDSVPRSKRPLQDFPDGDQPLPLEVKRSCWERLGGSPPPSQKAPQPSLLSSPSHRAPSQACVLTSSRYWDDSDLDASLLEPSDGEEPDSPWGLSPEAEAKLLEDDPEEDGVDTFPPFGVFGTSARTAEGSCVPASPEAAQPQSISGAPEKTPCGKPLSPTGPPDPCSGGLACRSGSVAPACGGHLHGGAQNRAGLGLPSSSPGLPAVVPVEAASVSPEKEGKSCALSDEGAAQAGRDEPAAGWLTKGPTKEQASLVLQLGWGRAGRPPGESEGESQAASKHFGSAGNPSEARVGKPSPQQPKRPKQQICVPQADLEDSMHSYINTVLAHMNCRSPDMGPVNELHALMQRVSAEHHSQGHGFRHPADLTMRNYAERVNRTTPRCTLGQWVVRNQPDRPLFADVPDCFERSPIPSL